MQLVDCTLAAHGEAILAIYNEAILNSTAIYEYVPRPRESMQAWFADKARGFGRGGPAFPVIGALDADGGFMGFATYGVFRARPAYKYTAEHSVYIDAARRGRGVGATLLAALIERARAQDLHTLVGGVDAANAASLALHRGLGFTHAGTIRQAAFKFGRWLDLDFWQLVLATPAQPLDG